MTPASTIALTMMASGGILVAVSDSMIHAVLMCLVPLGVLAFYLKGSKMLGKLIEEGIESYDKKLLGVDVEVGSMKVNPFGGFISIKDLTVKNPDKFESDYLLHAGSIKIDLQMHTAILSRFQTIVVDKVSFKNIDAIFEKKGYIWGESNFHVVIEHLSGGGDKPAEASDAATTTKSDDATKPDASAKPGEATEGGGRKIIIKEVTLEDIGVKMETKLAGVRAAVGDIHYDDFSDQVKSGMMEDIIKEIFKTLAKSIVANVLGKAAADKLL